MGDTLTVLASALLRAKTERNKFRRSWTAALAIVVALSCRTGDTESRLRAQQEWNKNIAIVQTCVDGTPDVHNTEEDLMAASIFLEDLTGISTQLDGGSIILAKPTPGTDDALVELRKWYEQHKDQLRWDEARKRVVILTP